jgi:hypothetical protein
VRCDEEGPVDDRIIRTAAYAALGAAPGLVLVLLAQFVIDGEMQLTVGAPGILLAVAGALVGLVYGSRRRADRPPR